jgi:hypothetical protein
VRLNQPCYLRLQAPIQACSEDAAEALQQGLLAVSGVYQAKMYIGQQKLVVRYHAALCSCGELAQQLYQLLDELDQNGLFYIAEPALPADAAPTAPGLRQRLSQSRIGRWWSETTQAAQETVQAMKIIGKVSTRGPKALIKDPEKAAIDFLNDILALYLIRSHWNHITQQWLPNPWRHRYEWLSVFYMFFLLVRSRKKT